VKDPRQAEQDLADACHYAQQQQRYPAEPKPANAVINRWIARRGLAAEVSSEELQRCWTRLVGEPLAARTRVGNLRRKTLEVTVDGSVVMQQLQFQQHQLLEGLQQALPHYGITKLAFRNGRFD
jgi:predicted nucleic acid-binding Zn ribbon protein